MASQLRNKFVEQLIAKMYLDEESADVRFSIQTNGTTEFIPAHKSILAKGSLVFHAMFFGPLKENEVVEITDASADAFREFIQFFYCAEVTLTMENIEGVAYLADKYDMLECVNTCSAFLEDRLNKENMFWAYQLAISLDNQKLKRFCEEKIIFMAEEVFKSETFQHCDQKVLKHILQMDRLACRESQVFNACLEWAKISCRRNGLDENNAENLRQQLDDCFYLIRFGAMNTDEIGIVMSNESYDKLFTRDELAEILRITSIKNYQPKIFGQQSRLNLSFLSNSNPELVCQRRMATSAGDPYYIQAHESVLFSTNIPILFGKCQCTSFRHMYGENFVLKFNINVIEYTSQTSETNTGQNIFYTETVNFENDSAPTVLLPQAVLIKPENMYEITLSCTSDIECIYRHYDSWKSEDNLDKDVTIVFHLDMLDGIAQRRGLISTLHFKRV